MTNILPKGSDIEIARDAVRHAETLEELTERHNFYRALEDLGGLVEMPSSEELWREVKDILEGIGTSEAYADTSAFLTSVYHGDGDFSRLDPLGLAIKTVAESERGFTDNNTFQSTVRFLLAKNGYNPIKIVENKSNKQSYDVFSDNKTGLVVIGEKEPEIWTVHLKDKFQADNFFDDFFAYRKGTNKEIAAVEFNETYGGLAGCLGYVLGLTACAGLGNYISETTNINGYIAGGAATFLFTIGTLTFAYSRINKNEKYINELKKNFPHDTLVEGVYALLDAFPIKENPVR